jgi:hypothetical protein
MFIQLLENPFNRTALATRTREFVADKQEQPPCQLKMGDRKQRKSRCALLHSPLLKRFDTPNTRGGALKTNARRMAQGCSYVMFSAGISLSLRIS